MASITVSNFSDRLLKVGVTFVDVLIEDISAGKFILALYW